MENCDVQEKAEKKVSTARQVFFQRGKIRFLWRSNNILCMRQEHSLRLERTRHERDRWKGSGRRRKNKSYGLGAAQQKQSPDVPPEPASRPVPARTLEREGLKGKDQVSQVPAQPRSR